MSRRNSKETWRKTKKKLGNSFVTVLMICWMTMASLHGWLVNGVGYKPCRLKQILKDKKPNKRKSKFTSTDFQEIYDFRLDNSINSNESAYNMKRINKRSFLEQFSNVNEPNVIEKRVQLQNSSKFIFTAPIMIYTKSVHKLHSSFCQTFTRASLTIFFRYKPYYCVKPTEKEKLSCLCINCLNSHLLLQSINIYRKSKDLPSHDSLTEYIDRLNKGESFEEANDDKAWKFYSYQRVVERYIGKEGKPVKYQRTARADDTKPVKHLVNLIKGGGSKYKKHQSYVDNCSLFSQWWKMSAMKNSLSWTFHKI